MFCGYFNGIQIRAQSFSVIHKQDKEEDDRIYTGTEHTIIACNCAFWKS